MSNNNPFYKSRAKKFVLLITLTISAMLSTFANGASFDCRRANNSIEKMICSDGQLSKLDEDLAQAYQSKLKELTMPEERKALRSRQREWAKNLYTNPYISAPNVLIQLYTVRIEEIRNFRPAKTPPPNQSEVMVRLTSQLEKLKELLTNSMHMEIAAGPIGAFKSNLCKRTWEKLGQAGIPTPMIFANTSKQKRDLYLHLREVAKHNQRLFFAKSNVVQTRPDYQKNFAYVWSEYRDYGEFSGPRRDSAYMLFDRPNVNTGTKRPVVVVVLLDQKDDGLSLQVDSLGDDGLFLPGELQAYSLEWYAENDIDRPHEGPSFNAGILSLGSDIAGWSLRKTSSPNHWLVVIGPIRNAENETDTSCSFEFN